MEKSHLYLQTDALLVGAASDCGYYKEEGFRPIGLRNAE